MKKSVPILLAAITYFLLLTGPSWAFECPDIPLEEKFNKAERVFLVYVTETKLEEDLLKKMNHGFAVDGDNSESIKLLSASYRVIEEFKGLITDQPKLLDLMGPDTGYAGVYPGVYYLLMIPPVQEGEDKNIRIINKCMLYANHYRLNLEPFQERLDEIRELRDSPPQ